MMLHLTDRMSTHVTTIALTIQQTSNATISSVYTVVQRHVVAMTAIGKAQYHVVEVSMKNIFI